MRIGTPDDLGKIESLFFKFSLQVASLVFFTGLIIDWFVGHEMFQRFGALLVGLGVLHYFYTREIEGQIGKYEMLERTYGEIISCFLPCPIDPNDAKYASALNTLTLYFEPRAQAHASAVAKMTLDEVIEADSELPRLRVKLKDVHKTEILMVIVGTVIWAFGDLLTNFFFHCDWNWSCFV